MIVWLAVLPMVAALAVAPFRRTRHIAAPMAAAALVLMALLAVTLGDAGPVIALGRVLRLLPGERATLAIVWVLVAVTILCTYRIPQQSLLYPLALAAVGMLTAAAMTRHLAIAALLLELGAILTVMLIPARVAGAASVSVRLLVLFAVAGACVLLASWTQDARAAGLEGDALLSMGAICLTLGGGILLAAGPLGLWLPSVFQFDNPLASVMLGAALPTTALICLTDALASLRPPGVPGFWSDLLLAGGVLACLIGGLGATMQASLRRIAGYAAVADMGIVFMALGLNPMGEMGISAGHVLYRALAITVVCLASNVFQECLGGDDPERLQGGLRYAPTAVLGMIVGGLTLAGAPPTIGFASRVSVYRGLMSAQPSWVVLVVLTGFGVAWAFTRCAIASLSVATTPRGRRESWWTALWILPLSLLLLFLPYVLAISPSGWFAFFLSGG